MPKSRAITWANKKKFPSEEPMSIRNDAGYYDPTQYLAFKNMERKDTAAHSNAARITTRRAGWCTQKGDLYKIFGFAHEIKGNWSDS